jgi:hypothetical protein
MQGVDPGRYSQDLAACRQYAGLIDAQGEAMAGLIGGMILGAALGSSYGVRGRHLGDTASYGGLVGITAASNRATTKQERILINCLTGRGYRALDGPMVMPGSNSTVTPMPRAADVGGTTSVNAAPALAGTPPAANYLEAARAAQQGPKQAVGQPGESSYEIERMAEVRQCHPEPRAMLSTRGAGFEVYTVACANGDALLLRCEWRECRVLR